MATRFEQARQRHETTNTTGRHLLVANYHLILGSYGTPAEADEARLAIGAPGPDGLAETPYSVLHVLAPGQSVAGELLAPVSWDDGTDAVADLDAMFGGADA